MTLQQAQSVFGVRVAREVSGFAPALRCLGAVAALGFGVGCTPPPSPLQYPEVTAAIMTRVDVNGDGVVDAAEFAPVAPVGESLSIYDADGNGTLSAIEVEQSFLKAQPLPTRLPGGAPGAAPGGGPGGGPPGPLGPSQPRPMP